MSAITYFVVLPFLRNQDGDLCADEAIEVPSEGAARRRAAAVAHSQGGAIAFSRTGDPATGEFDDAVILARCGDVPADLVDFMVGG